MSTRTERQDWQDFRERMGRNVTEFKKKWFAMFGRNATDAEIQSYRDEKKKLTAPLGAVARAEEPAVDEMAEAKRRAEIVGITRRYEWDMAHRIPAHEGKCRRLHGHRYAVEIEVGGTLQASGSSEGMVMDFGDLDKHVDSVIGFWDHRTMLHEADECLWIQAKSDLYDADLGVFRVDFIPTAENIALRIKRELKKNGLNVWRVRVYETPRSWAEA